MKTFALAAAFAVMLSTTASAQTTAPATAPAVTATQQAAPANRMNLKGQWRASKLMGLDIYNENNEKLGDVNELIIDKDGKITAVVIGVGGFLGMGEHDIAVGIDKLKFVETPVRTSAAAPATTTERRETTGATATTTTTTTTATATGTTAAYDWVPDHAVMSATKDQLKALPQFKYSDYN